MREAGDDTVHSIGSGERAGLRCHPRARCVEPARVWRRARRRAGRQSRIPKNGCELSPVDAPRRDGGDTEHGFTIEDAFIFLSVACDAGVAQACKPAEGFGTIARFSIPKIDACPAPFQA